MQVNRLKWLGLPVNWVCLVIFLVGPLPQTKKVIGVGTARFTPNDDASLAEAIDAGGVARNFSYDLLKRISTIRNGDGSERGLEVDESDNIVGGDRRAGPLGTDRLRRQQPDSYDVGPARQLSPL